MYRCALAVAVAAGIVAPAAAQTRSFPQNTLRGTIAFAEDGTIALNGRATTLSPGSRVRDEQNMIVLPAGLVGTKRLVHYTLDIGGGQVRDVWILRPDEAAIRPWPATLEQANTWTFDPTTMTWTKP
ncbi:putative protein OS=Rhizobacter sp. Root404 OX=1736528 GN=ASC76_01460 PE=4 SV=1 [Rhizobacter fulvus]